MIGFTIVLKKRKRRHIKKRKKTGKKFLYFLPVIFIMIFSVCASFFIGDEDEKISKREQITDSISVFREIDDYSLYYLPVVMNEFFEYKSGQDLSDDMIITIGVLSILSTESTEKYEAFDGELVIGEKELKERAETIFSEDIVYKNKTPENSQYKIYYDKETENYIIPTQGFSPRYSAVLESVTAKGNETVLSVGCLENSSFKQDSSGNTVIPEAEKKIEIILKKDKNGYYIDQIS